MQLPAVDPVSSQHNFTRAVHLVAACVRARACALVSVYVCVRACGLCAREGGVFKKMTSFWPNGKQNKR